MSLKPEHQCHTLRKKEETKCIFTDIDIDMINLHTCVLYYFPVYIVKYPYARKPIFQYYN